MRAGLDGGDDLHGRVTAANSALAAILAPRLSGEAADYLSLANQFVLNVIMAACAVMISAGAGIAESRMVVAAGGNGVDFGWRLAETPAVWHTIPARTPVGPHFPHAAEKRFLPAIGDSAVIDACGFGAAALRYAPEMIAALRSHVPDDYFGAPPARRSSALIRRSRPICVSASTSIMPRRCAASCWPLSMRRVKPASRAAASRPGRKAEAIGP